MCPTGVQRPVTGSNTVLGTVRGRLRYLRTSLSRICLSCTMSRQRKIPSGDGRPAHPQPRTGRRRDVRVSGTGRQSGQPSRQIDRRRRTL